MTKKVTESDHSDTEDIVELSSSSLAALQEFYQERQQLETQFESLKAQSERGFASAVPISLDLFTEDWQMSQFWYDEKTCDMLAEELIRNGGRIICISAPSAFIALHNKLLNTKSKPILMEFDTRFQVLGPSFVRYDYNDPLNFKHASLLRHQFDTVLADPPFLSEECLQKTCETIRHLAKRNARVVLCTGQVMRDLADRELGVKPSRFRPCHRNGLSNEFACYVNYESADNDFNLE